MWLKCQSAHALANGRRARCDLRPQLGTFFGNRALNRRTLHLALIVHDDAGVVLEVDENAITTAPSLLLANHHGFHHLLPQLWLALLARSQDEIAGSSLRQPAQCS